MLDSNYWIKKLHSMMGRKLFLCSGTYDKRIDDRDDVEIYEAYGVNDRLIMITVVNSTGGKVQYEIKIGRTIPMDVFANGTLVMDTTIGRRYLKEIKIEPEKGMDERNLREWVLMIERNFLGKRVQVLRRTGGLVMDPITMGTVISVSTGFRTVHLKIGVDTYVLEQFHWVTMGKRFEGQGRGNAYHFELMDSVTPSVRKGLRPGLNMIQLRGRKGVAPALAK